MFQPRLALEQSVRDLLREFHVFFPPLNSGHSKSFNYSTVQRGFVCLGRVTGCSHASLIASPFADAVITPIFISTVF